MAQVQTFETQHADQSKLSSQLWMEMEIDYSWKWTRKCFAHNSAVKWNIFTTFVVREMHSKNRPKMSINKWWAVAVAEHTVKTFFVTTSIRTFLLIKTEKLNSMTACALNVRVLTVQGNMCHLPSVTIKIRFQKCFSQCFARIPRYDIATMWQPKMKIFGRIRINWWSAVGWSIR